MGSSMNIHGDSAREAVLRCINDGLVDDCLQELAHVICQRVQGITGDPLKDIPAAIITMDAELTLVLTKNDSHAVGRRGVEMHGKLERLNQEIKTMDQNDPDVQRMKKMLTTLVQRVLTEAFKIQP